MARIAPTLASSSKVIATPQRHRRVGTGLPTLSIIIVNYRQWERTYELVRQLQNDAALRSGDVEVVIVDNHSPSHPLQKKLRRTPGVSLRRWRRNHGFARAVNEGCRLAQGDWFLLLNPDTTLAADFIQEALNSIDAMAQEPSSGIVGFHLRNSDGSQQLSTGNYPTLLSTITRLALPRDRRKYHAPRGMERAAVSWVTGCCLLVRRACVEDLGGLDEEFFLYYEDVDLCLRAGTRGWDVWFEPKLAVVHHNPLHSRKVPAALRLVTRHSLLVYALKHWSRLEFRILAGIVKLEAWSRRLKAWWHGDPHEAAHYRALALLVTSMVQGNRAAARKHLDDAMHHIDVRVGV